MNCSISRDYQEETIQGMMKECGLSREKTVREMFKNYLREFVEDLVEYEEDCDAELKLKEK